MTNIPMRRRDDAPKKRPHPVREEMPEIERSDVPKGEKPLNMVQIIIMSLLAVVALAGLIISIVSITKLGTASAEIESLNGKISSLVMMQSDLDHKIETHDHGTVDGTGLPAMDITQSSSTLPIYASASDAESGTSTVSALGSTASSSEFALEGDSSDGLATLVAVGILVIFIVLTIVVVMFLFTRKGKSTASGQRSSRRLSRYPDINAFDISEYGETPAEASGTEDSTSSSETVPVQPPAAEPIDTSGQIATSAIIGRRSAVNTPIVNIPPLDELIAAARKDGSLAIFERYSVKCINVIMSNANDVLASGRGAEVKFTAAPGATNFVAVYMPELENRAAIIFNPCKVHIDYSPVMRMLYEGSCENFTRYVEYALAFDAGDELVLTRRGIIE